MAYFERKKEFYMLCFISWMIFGTEASRITFKAYPNVLKANLTSAVAMRCELSDTEVTRMSVTNTTDDIVHATSILITHSDGQVEVAHVSAFDAATAFIDVGNLEAKGDVTGSSSEGFLQLAWKIPSLMTLGEYACEIQTIDNHHRATVFRSTLEMSEEAPSINDLVVMFQTLQHTTKENDAKNAAEIKVLQHKVSNQSLQILNQSNQIFNQSNQILDQSHQILNQSEHMSKQDQQILNQSEQMNKQDQQITSLTQVLNNQTAEVAQLKICMSSHVAFMAVMSTTMSFSTYQPIIYDKVLINTDGGYHSSTGEFSCQTPGVYYFSVNSVVKAKYVCLNLRINSVIITTAMAYDSSNYESGSASAVVQLKKGDKVQVVANCGNPVVFYKDNTIVQANVFTGHLLHNDACLP